MARSTVFGLKLTQSIVKSNLPPFYFDLTILENIQSRDRNKMKLATYFFVPFLVSVGTVLARVGQHDETVASETIDTFWDQEQLDHHRELSSGYNGRKNCIDHFISDTAYYMITLKNSDRSLYMDSSGEVFFKVYDKTKDSNDDFAPATFYWRFDRKSNNCHGTDKVKFYNIGQGRTMKAKDVDGSDGTTSMDIRGGDTCNGNMKIAYKKCSSTVSWLYKKKTANAKWASPSGDGDLFTITKMGDLDEFSL